MDANTSVELVFALKIFVCWFVLAIGVVLLLGAALYREDDDGWPRE